MTIVTVIPISTENGHRAEFLIDFISQLNQRKPRGHALLAFDSVHEEVVQRVKISAELAFESFDLIIVASKDTKQAMASAIVRRNNLYLSAFEYCQRTFRVPFLVLEPECCPTNQQWMEKIQKAYEAQARRYLLCHLRDSETSPRFPLSVGVMHMGLWADIAKACAEAPETPWERVAGENIIGRSSKTRAFQPLRVVEEADFQKVWPEAQVVVGDISGALIENYRSQGVHLPVSFPGVKREDEKMFVIGNPESEIRYGPCDATFGITPSDREKLSQPLPKIDLRSKAGRALKKMNGNGQPH